MKKSLIYPGRNGSALPFDLYLPDQLPETGKCPCIVFWFGGGWMGGKITQFARQAAAFNEKGFAALLPGYTTWQTGGNILTCMQDAACFLRFMGEHAPELSIDPDSVFLSGGSAGAHLALSTQLFSSIPNALTIRGLVLFNPVVDTTPQGYQSDASLKQDWNPAIFSPLHFLLGSRDASLPPAIIFHGEEDDVMPLPRVRLFCEEALSRQKDITLITYPGKGHGFFNFFPDRSNEAFYDTLQKAMEFCLTRV